MNGLTITICLALWLWSSPIGADPPWPDDPPVAAAAPLSPPGPGKSQGKLPVHRSERPPLPLEGGANLDRSAFLSAFGRQAQAALLPCLRQWQASPGAVGVTATLDRQGRLRHLTALDPARVLPDCASEAADGMAFAAVAAGLTRPAVNLQWRIDW